METIKRVYDIAKSNAEHLAKEIESLNKYSILERCNTICYIEETAMSIAYDDKGEPYMNYSIHPMQFTPEKADDICKSISNGHGHKPKPISYREFCELRLKYETNLCNEWEMCVRELGLI